MLTQKEINCREGHINTFWGNVDKRADGKWLWTGHTNTNHNTVECKKYEYGEFSLNSVETSNFSKPTRIHKSKIVHRIILFLVYGRQVERHCEVFPINGDHLDINPANLMIRNTKAKGIEQTPAEYYAAANDNVPERMAA